MFKSLRWRLVIIVLAIAISGWQLYSKGLSLGLDLQGGMYLMLEVDDPDGTMTAEAKADMIDRVDKVIRIRIDEFGVEEPLVQRYGNDRLIVELAGAADEDEAAQAFERYDLISAPVVDAQGKLFGRLTIDEMVDYIREESEAEVLNAAGLREEEDIFASVWKSVRNRWAWLAINLCTALIASRVIGLFEGAIEQLVALAALMPIVAGIGGNSGNQTITMIVRGLATGQVQAAHGKRLIRKETGVALINGLFWGLVLALIAYLLYGNAALSVVLLSAMTLNMLLAAVMGVWIPLLRVRMGGDPALGSSVMITAITDSGGFFIFLGLATLFLL